MAPTDEKIKAAQALWELQLAILQEEERRLVSALEEPSRAGAQIPQELRLLARLKAARTQCNEAFQSLMTAVEERVARDTGAAILREGQGNV
ncbi:MAG: hypothetical protein Q8Q73_08110 [Stagnimonas sp.]|nr:hypothetical protein [Stagnimonas sp.]